MEQNYHNRHVINDLGVSFVDRNSPLQRYLPRIETNTREFIRNLDPLLSNVTRKEKLLGAEGTDNGADSKFSICIKTDSEIFNIERPELADKLKKVLRDTIKQHVSEDEFKRIQANSVTLFKQT